MKKSSAQIFLVVFLGGNKYKKSFVSFTVSELDELHKKAYAIVDVLSDITQKLPAMEEEGLSRKVRFPGE